MAERLYRVRNPNGVELGPAPMLEVCGWIAEGQVHLDATAADSGSGIFHPITQYSQFANAFEARFGLGGRPHGSDSTPNAKAQGVATPPLSSPPTPLPRAPSLPRPPAPPPSARAPSLSRPPASPRTQSFPRGGPSVWPSAPIEGDPEATAPLPRGFSGPSKDRARGVSATGDFGAPDPSFAVLPVPDELLEDTTANGTREAATPISTRSAAVEAELRSAIDLLAPVTPSPADLRDPPDTIITASPQREDDEDGSEPATLTHPSSPLGEEDGGEATAVFAPREGIEPDAATRSDHEVHTPVTQAAAESLDDSDPGRDALFVERAEEIIRSADARFRDPASTAMPIPGVGARPPAVQSAAIVATAGDTAPDAPRPPGLLRLPPGAISILPSVPPGSDRTLLLPPRPQESRARALLRRVLAFAPGVFGPRRTAEIAIGATLAMFALLFGAGVVARLGATEAELSAQSGFFYARLLLLFGASAGLSALVLEQPAPTARELGAAPRWTALALAAGAVGGALAPLVQLGSTVAVALSMTFLQTLAEGAYFRAFLDRALRQGLSGVVRPIVLSAVLFGLFRLTYLSLWQDRGTAEVLLFTIMSILVVGLPTAWLHHTSRSMVPPFVCQLTGNLVMIALSAAV